MARERQVFLDQPLRRRMHGNEPGLPRLPLTRNASRPAAVDVPDPQAAQRLAADAVIEHEVTKLYPEALEATEYASARLRECFAIDLVRPGLWPDPIWRCHTLR